MSELIQSYKEKPTRLVAHVWYTTMVSLKVACLGWLGDEGIPGTLRSNAWLFLT